MHFDPVASPEPTSPVRPSQIETSIDTPAGSDEGAREFAVEESAAAPRGREGLPPAFRMRHQRHYVEQLMGDGPIRTVREVGLAEIEPPPDDPADLTELERSIRALGVIEPLLVNRDGRQYRVITGMRRLRAARSAGLRSVPCIVLEADSETLARMREAASAKPAVPAASGAAPQPVAEMSPAALSEVNKGLAFVSALLPVVDAAGTDRLRWAVITDLAGVELQRARTVAWAAEFLARGAELSCAESGTRELFAPALASLSAEVRLRGAQLDVSLPEPDYHILLDPALVSAGITALLQGTFAMLPAGAAVRLQVKGTTVRPALIVQIAQEQMDLTAEGERRFFDPEWRDHPAGASGALLLAGAARVARLHGGRIDVQLLPVKGSTVTFVIPKRLGD